MPVPVVCPSCAARLSIPDNLAGRKIKCPKCGKPVLVEAETLPPVLETAEGVADQPLVPKAGKHKTKRPQADAVDSPHGCKPSTASRSRAPKRQIPTVVWFAGIGFGLFVICCGGCGFITMLGSSAVKEAEAKKKEADAKRRKDALEGLADADKLYAQNKPADAVAKYKQWFSDAESRKPDILKRIVEYEIKKGDGTEALAWIDKGLDLGVEVEYDNPFARAMLENRKKTRELDVVIANEERKSKDRSERAKAGKLSRDEFRQLVIGKTMQQVRDLLGKPNSTQDLGDTEFWYYEGKSIDPATNKKDFTAQIVFDGNTAKSVNFQGGF